MPENNAFSNGKRSVVANERSADSVSADPFSSFAFGVNGSNEKNIAVETVDQKSKILVATESKLEEISSSKSPESDSGTAKKQVVDDTNSRPEENLFNISTDEPPSKRQKKEEIRNHGGLVNDSKISSTSLGSATNSGSNSSFNNQNLSSFGAGSSSDPFSNFNFGTSNATALVNKSSGNSTTSIIGSLTSGAKKTDVVSVTAKTHPLFDCSRPFVNRNTTNGFRERWNAVCDACFTKGKDCRCYPELPLDLVVLGLNPSEDSWNR